MKTLSGSLVHSNLALPPSTATNLFSGCLFGPLTRLRDQNFQRSHCPRIKGPRGKEEDNAVHCWDFVPQARIRGAAGGVDGAAEGDGGGQG